MEIRRRRQQNKAAAVTAASDACESTWSKQKTRNVRVIYIYIPRVLDWQRGIENTHSQVYQASDWPSSNAWKQDTRCSSVNRKRLMKQMNWSTQARSVTTMNRPVLRRRTEQTWTIVYGGIVFLNIYFSRTYTLLSMDVVSKRNIGPFIFYFAPWRFCTKAVWLLPLQLTES